MTGRFVRDIARSAGGLAVAAALSAAPAAAEKYASIVVDAETDTILHARHADARRYPASLTKVMTLYMLFDEMKAGRLTLDDRIAVSRKASQAPPSKLRLSAGQTISVSDAIDALVTKSANDVAVAVAEHLGGGESRFATLMTVKAAALGMENTRFANASGLPDDRQVTTARDMAILAEAMIDNHPEYYARFATQRFAYGGRTYKNHNELLGDVDGVDGVKTGYIRASGYNLMASANRDGRRVIAVMMGGQTSKSRNAHVEALIEAAYDALNDTPDDDLAARMRTASLGVVDPLNPDAAAAPVLNGQAIVTADASAASVGGALSAAPPERSATPATPAIKPRTPVKPEPTVLAAAPAETGTTVEPKRQVAAETQAPKQAEAMPIGLSLVAARHPVPESIKAAAQKMSVADYEAAQFGGLN